MRKGFDSLCGLVTQELGSNPLNGDVFVFLNKPRNTIKLLHWEKDGLVIYHKRLEKGNFTVPVIENNQKSVEWTDLVLMLEGIIVEKKYKKRRFIM
jgi:transposase